MKAVVKHIQDVPAIPVGEGVTRRVMSYTDKMMVVEVAFEVGGVGAEHTHPHVQSTYVADGKFAFVIEGKEEIVCKGDTIVFEPDVLHGTTCLEKGKVIDIFAPMREDFIG